MSDRDEDLPFFLHKPPIADYLTGFLLAIALTGVPFYVVAAGDVGKSGTFLIVTVFALAQILVHLRYFLHYSTKRVPLEATIALALAVVIGAIIIAGAIWVMFDLNYRMMG